MRTKDCEEDWIHRVREQISKETEGMSVEDRVEYYNRVSREVLPNLRRVRHCTDAEKPAA